MVSTGAASNNATSQLIKKNDIPTAKPWNKPLLLASLPANRAPLNTLIKMISVTDQGSVCSETEEKW